MGLFSNIRERTADLWQPMLVRFDKQPIGTVVMLSDFMRTRSAYIAQTSLYGYLKTRMGTQYVRIFEDPVFAQSIDVAKWRVFAACLSDLVIFSTATIHAGAGDAEQATPFAAHHYTTIIGNALGEADVGPLVEESVAAFLHRSKDTNWANAAVGEAAFTHSPPALYHWAPIADELKRYDEEIVKNSIRYRWRDVRDQLRRRLDPVSVTEDWRAMHMGQPTPAA